MIRVVGVHRSHRRSCYSTQNSVEPPFAHLQAGGDGAGDFPAREVAVGGGPRAAGVALHAVPARLLLDGRVRDRHGAGAPAAAAGGRSQAREHHDDLLPQSRERGPGLALRGGQLPSGRPGQARALQGTRLELAPPPRPGRPRAARVPAHTPRPHTQRATRNPVKRRPKKPVFLFFSVRATSSRCAWSLRRSAPHSRSRSPRAS